MGRVQFNSIENCPPFPLNLPMYAWNHLPQMLDILKYLLTDTQNELSMTGLQRK